jgi:hypothetical protein
MGFQPHDMGLGLVVKPGFMTINIFAVSPAKTRISANSQEKFSVQQGFGFTHKHVIV